MAFGLCRSTGLRLPREPAFELHLTGSPRGVLSESTTICRRKGRGAVPFEEVLLRFAEREDQASRGAYAVLGLLFPVDKLGKRVSNETTRDIGVHISRQMLKDYSDIRTEVLRLRTAEA